MESNTTDKELLIPWCQRRGQIALWVTAMPGQSLLKDVVLLGVALSSAGEAFEAVRRRGDSRGGHHSRCSDIRAGLYHKEIRI